MKKIICILIAALVSCSGAQDGSDDGGMPAFVEVAAIESIHYAMRQPGRLVAYRHAEVYSQTSGILKKQLYTDGSKVTKDKPLFLVDKGIYDFEYKASSIKSPISGVARRSLVTEGAYINENTTHLTTIEQVDPMYIDFTRSASSYTYDHAANLLNEDSIVVTVINSDGSIHPHKGTISFADTAIDPATDSIKMRAVVPNPDFTLLPGAYVQVEFEYAHVGQAVTIPRDALMRTPGGAFVTVVNDSNIVEHLPVHASKLSNKRWIIDSGLSGGEKVIVSNAFMYPTGAKVTPTVGE